MGEPEEDDSGANRGLGMACGIASMSWFPRFFEPLGLSRDQASAIRDLCRSALSRIPPEPPDGWDWDEIAAIEERELRGVVDALGLDEGRAALLYLEALINSELEVRKPIWDWVLALSLLSSRNRRRAKRLGVGDLRKSIRARFGSESIEFYPDLGLEPGDRWDQAHGYVWDNLPLAEMWESYYGLLLACLILRENEALSSEPVLAQINALLTDCDWDPNLVPWDEVRTMLGWSGLP